MSGAIAAMPGRTRLVLTLHYYESLGPAAIARALDRPVVEVESLLAAGKETMARALGRRDPRADASGPGAHAA